MNLFDNTQAHEEGWEINHLIMKLEAYDPNQWLLPDALEHEVARDFVKLRAAEGLAYHIEALAYVAFTEPRGFGFKATYNPTIFSRIQKI